MSGSDPHMTESDPLTDKYRNRVLKLAVYELIEEKGWMWGCRDILTKKFLHLNQDALYKQVQQEFNSCPVDGIDINPAESDISHLGSPNNTVNHNNNATAWEDICSLSVAHNDEDRALPSKEGWPMGTSTTTITKKREYSNNYADCISATVFDYSTKLSTRKYQRRDAQGGSLWELIDQRKNIFVSLETFIYRLSNSVQGQATWISKTEGLHLH